MWMELDAGPLCPINAHSEWWLWWGFVRGKGSLSRLVGRSAGSGGRASVGHQSSQRNFRRPLVTRGIPWANSDQYTHDLQTVPVLFQKDMESLRYEISWKDERIEYLQKTLAEMEDSLPSSSADNWPRCLEMINEFPVCYYYHCAIDSLWISLEILYCL